ncbi:hypothetical protein DPMN_089532 [Dreissena polymorpha]|uniref:Uncharacterized protein n=2 Tax=Dreissena polymorpha TaxID=45954 RepID=A0A9D4QYZ2_DREPO|nr:hypothetical protein DPMN_089532 [Dreissena polymorpha]
MTKCASFILDTIACSQTVSTNNEVQVASNKHAEISTMHGDTHSDQSVSYSQTHLHADRNIMHDTCKQQASPLTASPVSIPPQTDYLNSIHLPQPMYPPFSFMPSPHAYSQRPYCLHLDNQYPFQESYSFYNNIRSFVSSLPPFPTNRISSPKQTPNPEATAPSTKQLNPGSLIKDSLSVAEYDTYGTCQKCVLKDTQLESLTEAYEKAQTDIQALYQRRELEGEISW